MGHPDLSVPLLVPLAERFFPQRTRSPEGHRMLAHFRMLCILHTMALVVRLHSGIVLQRNFLHLKHKTHPNLSLLRALLPVGLQNLFLLGLLRQPQVPLSKLQPRVEQIDISPMLQNSPTQLHNRYNAVNREPVVLRFLVVTTVSKVVQSICQHSLQTLGRSSCIIVRAALSPFGSSRCPEHISNAIRPSAP